MPLSRDPLVRYVLAAQREDVAHALLAFHETWAESMDLERAHTTACEAVRLSVADTEQRRAAVKLRDILGDRYDAALARWGLATEELAKLLEGAVARKDGDS